jgi:hypothetical protein
MPLVNFFHIFSILCPLFLPATTAPLSAGFFWGGIGKIAALFGTLFLQFSAFNAHNRHC